MIQNYIFQIPIYKGAKSALISQSLNTFVHGVNGMGDIDFWRHDIYPTNENELIKPENAVQIIRDLIIKVSFKENKRIMN